MVLEECRLLSAAHEGRLLATLEYVNDRIPEPSRRVKNYGNESIRR
jgi:hypothetical protein